MSLVLLAVVGVLFAIGAHLLMQRSLVRIVVGFVLLGHAANLALLLAGGPAGAPPLLGGERAPSGEPMNDPLPQAMALTAIVITFGVTAFLLALAYRSWLFLGEDEVQDDVEDRRVNAETRRDEYSAEEEGG
jgi:multicomponent Na+:H+ antiporter subunit C